MLAAYTSQPHNLGRADLAAAAAAPGTLQAFIDQFTNTDQRCRIAALNGVATLVSFDVPREVAAQVRELAAADTDPDVRVLARNIIDTWEIGSPAALQSKSPEVALPGAQLDAATLITESLTGGDSVEIGAALQLCVDRPELQSLPGVADLITNLEERVRAGQFDWRWVDSLVRLRPPLAQILIEHVRRGDHLMVRNAALAVPYLDTIPAVDRLEALASALGRLDERWSAASFEVLADRYPRLAIEAVCRTIESRQHMSPAGVWRLTYAGRRALELLDARERKDLMPRIARATAALSPTES
jgi:hypothetical protein